MKHLATAVLVSLLCALPLVADQALTVSGDYVEARSNEVYTCGCLYSGQMTTAGREAILAWRITRGVYDGTPLAGVKVAAVVVGDANLSAYDGPRRTALYLDESASEAQLRAIVALWQREYSQALGKIAAVHRASISFTQQGDAVHLSIPNLVEVQARKTRLPEDAHPGSFRWYEPFVPLRNSSLVTALNYEYSGVDFQHQWQDLMPSINGYLGEFALKAGG
ncbi:MAG TPA: DUF1326 domain-containing protein [Terriglobia bacterium]|nr:DUF1326 domain-containing protein [Terriglobia bacterium]